MKYLLHLPRKHCTIKTFDFSITAMPMHPIRIELNNWKMERIENHSNNTMVSNVNKTRKLSKSISIASNPIVTWIWTGNQQRTPPTVRYWIFKISNWSFRFPPAISLSYIQFDLLQFEIIIIIVLIVGIINLARAIRIHLQYSSGSERKKSTGRKCLLPWHGRSTADRSSCLLSIFSKQSWNVN